MDGSALLAAILHNHDDDAPRLIYADWLDENGDGERAEFIRVQCELARRYPGWSGIPASDSLERGGPYDTLRRRERELMDAHGYEWLAAGKPAPTCVVRCGREGGGWAWSEHGVWTIGLDWARGFVGLIHARAADWLAHGNAILAAHPVTEVRLATMPQMEHTSSRGFYFQRPDEEGIFLGSLIEWTPGGYRAEVANQLKIKWPAVKTWHLPGSRRLSR